jgi:hypothetical protein
MQLTMDSVSKNGFGMIFIDPPCGHADFQLGLEVAWALLPD